MLVPLPYVDGIGGNGCVEDKYRLAVPSDVQALALADGVILRPDVGAYLLAVALPVVVGAGEGPDFSRAEGGDVRRIRFRRSGGIPGILRPDIVIEIPENLNHITLS